MQGWRDRDSWDRLCRGDGCPLCAAVASGRDDDEHGLTVARTATSVIRLARNQRARGYCVVIAARHAVEPFELPAAEARAFFDDVLATARAVRQACDPVKLNYEVLGNGIPHLHCHVVPRYADDGSPGAPLPLFAEPPVHLPDEDFLALATRLAAAVREEVGGDDTLRFEPLGHDELPALQALCESCADYYHLMTGGPVRSSEAHTLFTLRPETASMHDKFLVGVRRGRDLIGVLDLYRHYPRRQHAWMGLLLLHPNLRGHGYGTAMIRWMVDWAREQGCTRLRLGVADDNQRALDVLGRHGFAPTGERISRVSGSRRLVLLPLELEIRDP
jgi:diadenosine tetraphosphate (Ap4A) HIT family hydrolase/RimJ/RimL family protein N-acetyltransferase